jgi:hypothetical protein
MDVAWSRQDILSNTIWASLVKKSMVTTPLAQKSPGASSQADGGCRQPGSRRSGGPTRIAPTRSPSPQPSTSTGATDGHHAAVHREDSYATVVVASDLEVSWVAGGTKR